MADLELNYEYNQPVPVILGRTQHWFSAICSHCLHFYPCRLVHLMKVQPCPVPGWNVEPDEPVICYRMTLTLCAYCEPSLLSDGSLELE